jgi:short-subunit dehydrogenase
MTQLQNKVVLITGANGGFGQHLMRQTLALGSKLIVSDLNTAQLGETVSQICAEVKSGEVLQCLEADLSNYEGCEKLYRETAHTPDVLINNAGIAMHGRFDEIPVEKWEKLMQINLLSPMRLVSMFLPDMIKRGSGHIVNISSLAGWIGSKGLSPYSASKYGLRGFGEALEDEMKAFNIKVTNAYPFFSKTPILDSPRFGTLEATTLPDSMTTDPAEVIRQVIVGIQKDQLHVFPDKTAKQLHWIKRLMPSLLPILTRQLSK